MKELFTLLKVQPDEVSGLLEEFSPDGCSCEENLSVVFHYIRFQDRLPRTSHFASKLCDHIVHYCLNREQYNHVESGQVRQIFLEAKEKFVQPKNGKTGEPGELIIFFLLEGYLRAPKIFSKMSLKTHPQMHVHGADGVHLSIDDPYVILYFGESKVYKSHTSAISDALRSVKEFVSPSSSVTGNTQADFEIRVLSNNLDIPPGSLRKFVLKVLDPYSEERSYLRSVHACFIGFDLDELAERCSETEFKAAYEKKAKSCYEHVVKKIAQDPVLQPLNWHFFFIPFESVDEFRNRFLQELKK